MGRVFREDRTKIEKIEKTAQGGLKIPAFLTRTGVFTYHDATTGKEIKEYRPPEEVFKADSLAMLRGATLTHDHPPEAVKPNNFKTYSIGHISDDVHEEGDKVGATLYVQDQQAINSVEAGRRELSCGYHVDVEETPGTTPEGERYDRIQRNIKYNHVALVPDGRAGHDVRLRLDSNSNQITGDKRMDIEIIGGVKYEAGTEAHQAAKIRHDAAVDQNRKTFASMKADLDREQARADAAEQKLEKLAAAVKKAFTPERLDGMVKVRTSIVEKAHAILGKSFKCDGLSNLQIKAAVVDKAFPGIRLDGKSDDYVKALFKAATVGKNIERHDGLSQLRQAITPVPGVRQDAAGGKTMAQLRADAQDSEANRSRRPLAISRSDTFKPLSNHSMIQGAQIEVMK